MSTTPATFSWKRVLKGRCPHCGKGKVMRSVFAIYRRCGKCGYDFYPENGFYLGAMVVAYLFTAILTIPPIVILKLLDVDMMVLLVFPFMQYFFLGTFLLYSSRILWLHLDYRMRRKLDGEH